MGAFMSILAEDVTFWAGGGKVKGVAGLRARCGGPIHT
jgi:hypothetical protein